MAVKERNYAIDFWKVVFAIMILLCHSAMLPTYFGEEAIASTSYLAVEFFFIVSGFLMVKSAQSNARKAEVTGVSLGKETLDFIIGKVKSISPYFILALFVWLLILLIQIKPSSIDFFEKFSTYVWDLSFLRMAGFRGYSTDSAVGGSWYLSAMLLSMFILYPMLRCKTEFFINCISPLFAFFSLGYICMRYGKLNYAIFWEEDGVIAIGLIRAIGEISLGCWCYGICERIKRYKFTRFAKIMLTFFEFLAYAGIILMMFFVKNGYYAFFVLPIYAIGITLSFSNITYSRKIFRGKVFKHFGTFSLCLYLNHYSWVKFLTSICLPLSASKELLIYILLSVSSSIISMYIIWLLSLIWKKLKPIVSKAIISNEVT